MGTLRGVWTRLKPMIEAAMNSPLRCSISLGATTDSVAGRPTWMYPPKRNLDHSRVVPNRSRPHPHPPRVTIPF
jgi:hypothetical protein